MAKILRLPTVCERTGLSRATLYRKVKEGNFPKQVKIADRAVGWIESDVEDWISTLALPANTPENFRGKIS